MPTDRWLVEAKKHCLAHSRDGILVSVGHLAKCRLKGLREVCDWSCSVRAAVGRRESPAESSGHRYNCLATRCN